MFSLPVRIIIVFAATVCGVYNLLVRDPFGYVCLAAAAILIVGYFRYGSIRPAFMAMRRGDLNVAQKHIETIRFPKMLSAESRAYRHWTCGVLAAETSGDWVYAEEQLRLAIDGAIRTSHDRCLATATLANIVARSNDLKRARQLLAEAEQIPHRDKASAYLKELKAEFTKAD